MDKKVIEAIEYIKELIKPPLREEWDFAYKLDKTTAKQFKVLVKCMDKLQKELKDSINARFELQRRIDKLQKENEVLKENNLSYQEELAEAWEENEALKEVHKEFATLCRKLKTDDTLMSAKSVMEKVVSKDKIRAKIKELEETSVKELRYDFLMNRDEVKSAFIRILEELLN